MDFTAVLAMAVLVLFFNGINYGVFKLLRNHRNEETAWYVGVGVGVLAIVVVVFPLQDLLVEQFKTENQILWIVELFLGMLIGNLITPKGWRRPLPKH